MVSLNIELVQALMQDREREARERARYTAARRTRRRRKRGGRRFWFGSRRRIRPAT